MCRVAFDPPVNDKNGRWHTARITFECRPRVLRWKSEQIKHPEFYPTKEELDRGWIEKRLFVSSFPELEVIIRE